MRLTGVSDKILEYFECYYMAGSNISVTFNVNTDSFYYATEAADLS